MKAKEITALVGYYDTEMRNLQNALKITSARFDMMENRANIARKEAETLRERSACLSKFAGMDTEEVYNWLEAADFDRLSDKYNKLEQLHEAAVTGFKSDTELLQLELDAAKEEARSAQQEVVYLKNALDCAFSSLACVTVDAVAHCNVEREESLRTFIGLVKEHVVLNIHDRIDLDAMLSNLDHDF